MLQPVQRLIQQGCEGALPQSPAFRNLHAIPGPARSPSGFSSSTPIRNPSPHNYIDARCEPGSPGTADAPSIEGTLHRQTRKLVPSPPNHRRRAPPEHSPRERPVRIGHTGAGRGGVALLVVAAKGALRRSPTSSNIYKYPSPTDCRRIDSSDATRRRRRWGEEEDNEPFSRCHRAKAIERRA
jgi:hypothetical protein